MNWSSLQLSQLRHWSWRSLLWRRAPTAPSSPPLSSDPLAPPKVWGWGMAMVAICCMGLIVETMNEGEESGPITRMIVEAYAGLSGTSQETLMARLRRQWIAITITENDIDVVTRTVIGEAATQSVEGKIAVVHVILNRARLNSPWYGGNNLADVSLHRARVLRTRGWVTIYQFEPWMHSHRRTYLWGLSKQSALYKEMRKLVMGCINGRHPDPTDGATHFLNPDIVRARTGGSLPGWARGEGRRIGDHVFFRHQEAAL